VELPHGRRAHADVWAGVGALISQVVEIPPNIEAAFREALTLPELGLEPGTLSLIYDGDRHILDLGLLQHGQPVGSAQWTWSDRDTVVWTGLETPVDEGWLSHLSGVLPPIAAQMGFKTLTAPVTTEKLAELLPLTGLELQDGVFSGDLGKKNSRFWSYLDFKAGRKPEPQWRKDLRVRPPGGSS
jgi:hypothetical protein